MQGSGLISHPVSVEDEDNIDEVEEVDRDIGPDSMAQVLCEGSAQTRLQSAEQADCQEVDNLIDALLDEVCDLCECSVSAASEQPGMCHSVSFSQAQTDSSSDSTFSSIMGSTVLDLSPPITSSTESSPPTYVGVAHAAAPTQPMTSCQQKGFVATATAPAPASADFSGSAITSHLTLPCVSTGLASDGQSSPTALGEAPSSPESSQAAASTDFRDHDFLTDSDTDSDDESGNESLGDSDDETRSARSVQPRDHQVCRSWECDLHLSTVHSEICAKAHTILLSSISVRFNCFCCMAVIRI